MRKGNITQQELDNLAKWLRSKKGRKIIKKAQEDSEKDIENLFNNKVYRDILHIYFDI